MAHQIQILVGTLNWGIGHASRMIPLIRAIQRTDAGVMLASSGQAGELLKTEFPGLPYHALPSFTIRYSRKKSQALAVALRVPRLLTVIFREHRWLIRFMRSHHVDIVISDNCYGLFSKRILSVLVSHQIHPHLPHGFAWLEPFVHAVLARFIRSFDRCWIPDEEDPAVNLSGILSHRYPLLPNTRFMGILSRFGEAGSEAGDGAGKETVRKAYVLVMLSGPEPQRTVLEEILMRQLEKNRHTSAIVRGMPHAAGQDGETTARDGIVLYDHLPADALRITMQNAGIIVCRSGYSTVMDLAETGLSAVLVPTPGQPEQEYLASHLSRQGFFHTINQEDFDLTAAIALFHTRDKWPPDVFRTDTKRYLIDLQALYEKKKSGH